MLGDMEIHTMTTRLSDRTTATRLLRSVAVLAVLAALAILLSACKPAPEAPQAAASAASTASKDPPKEQTRGAEAPIPKLVSENGRHALLVDGAPFLMLGAQVNNSSNYPAALENVWPA